MTGAATSAVKFSEFPEKIIQIAGSMIEALDFSSERESDLTRVSNDRPVPQNKCPSNSATNNTKSTYKEAVLSCPSNVSAPTTDQCRVNTLLGRSPLTRPSTTAPMTNSSSSIPSQMGQPIPVVSLGVTRHQTAFPAQVDVDRGDVTRRADTQSHCHQEAARHRPSQQRPVSSQGTVVIDTSLVNGLGQRLNKLGISATTFMYRGVTLPVLHNRVKHVLNCHDQPELIVLQCGGNDAETQPAAVVTTRIETLVHDIKRLSPKNVIMITKIPPGATVEKF